MSTSPTTPLTARVKPLIILLLVGGIAISSPYWWTHARSWASMLTGSPASGSVPSAAADDTHGHQPSAGRPSLHLSPQGRKNLGLTEDQIRPITLRSWQRVLDVPAMMIEQPGCAHITVATPMTGIVTEVATTMGQAVEPGDPLFEMRLTHEDLVRTQVEFVRTLGELDVELKELERLRDISESGAIAGRSFLERQYARDKLQALIQAQRESLRLHGLSEAQVQQITEDRRLLQDLRIVVPPAHQHSDHAELHLSDRETPSTVLVSDSEELPHRPAPMIVEQLPVHTGQAVSAGQDLCVLVNHELLYIEALAFEQDASFVLRAQEKHWPMQAVLNSNGDTHDELNDLQIEFVASNIDVQSRTLKFYLPVRNELLRDETDAAGRRYIMWKYRPGQRMTLRVPVEKFDQQIVVPVDAVADDGAESFVFLENGDGFDQVAVHVLHRDRHSIVIANDGSLFPGDRIAMKSAHQIQMAIRNQTVGGIDPHAGHSH